MAAWGKSSWIFWERICTFAELVWVSLIGFSYCLYYANFSPVLKFFYWGPFIGLISLASSPSPSPPHDWSHFLQLLANECKSASTEMNLSGTAKIHPPMKLILFRQGCGHMSPQLSLLRNTVLIWLSVHSSWRHCDMGFLLVPIRQLPGLFLLPTQA